MIKGAVEVYPLHHTYKEELLVERRSYSLLKSPIYGKLGGPPAQFLED